jgi:L-alanine-DL-glutamate epimerase-like enolase superfamily enzyme
MGTASQSASGIDRIEIAACTIPTDFPESDGTMEWDKTTIVIVQVKAEGATGIGYTYADISAATLIDRLLRGVVQGRDPMDIAGAWTSMVRAVRNVGRPGIASMAIAAVDIALWDLKARLLQLPLVKLLGSVRTAVPAYGSGGFTSYSPDQLQAQLAGWAASGIRMVKMKIGRDPDKDIERVRCAREAIGTRTELFVDANGAYSCKQALGFSEPFHELDVRWFEEPVSSDDLDGLRLIRNRAPAGMDIAAGEYGYDANYFRTMLQAGSVDVLQADATRCAGITGFLMAGALCGAHSMRLSAHTAPAIHMHVCCAVPSAIHVEYFHDHVRIENMLFEGVSKPIGGELTPDLSRRGMGLEVRRGEVARYAAG